MFFLALLLLGEPTGDTCLAPRGSVVLNVSFHRQPCDSLVMPKPEVVPPPPEPKPNGLSPFWKYGPAVANAFDAYATERALKAHGPTGSYAAEANPTWGWAVDNEPAFYASKIGSGLLMGIVANELAKHGHPAWGKIFSGMNIAVPIGLGAHNLSAEQQIKSGKK